MATVRVVLLESVSGLGRVGEVVGVALGYARYLLRPRKDRRTGRLGPPIALRATRENLSAFERKREELVLKDARLRSVASDLLEKVREVDTVGALGADVELVLLAQASGVGRLYGSIRPRQVLEAFVEKKGDILGEAVSTLSVGSVQMSGVVRDLGLFPAGLRLYPGVDVKLVLNVARSVEDARRRVLEGPGDKPDQGGGSDRWDRETTVAEGGES